MTGSDVNLVVGIVAIITANCFSNEAKIDRFPAMVAQELSTPSSVGDRKKLNLGDFPDFSHAGYHYCGKPIPSATGKNHQVFDVTNYGAIADDGKSDRDAFLKTFDAAHTATGPAIIWCPPGRWNLNESSDLGKPPLVIKRDNVVLRGAGPAVTELYFAQPGILEQFHLSISPDVPKDYYWRGGKRVAKIMSNPEPGGFALDVDDTALLNVGDWVMIDADLNVNTDKGKAYFSPHEVPPGALKGRRKPGIIDFMFEMHQIKSIADKQVTFNEPIHLALNSMENAVLWSLDHQVREVGIEDLALAGNYRGLFKHHNGSRFGEDYRMLRFSDAVDCWTRNVRITDYSNAIEVWRSARNTFMNISLDGNPGHKSFTAQMSYGNLVAYVREITDCHHGLGVSRSGTNTVFLRCMQYANLEAHCGYPRASLFDCNEGMFQPRGGGATYTPHHGKRLCFWNWKATKAETVDFWPEDKPYGYFMPPIIVGLHGSDVKLVEPAKKVKVNKSQGAKVLPESLFEAQLERRLGRRPEWLATESALFESVSRYSSVAIASPADHSEVAEGAKVSVTLEFHANMDLKQVKQTELQISTRSRFEGFRTIVTVPGPQKHIEVPADVVVGVCLLRARMTNSRGEVVYSLPITIFGGNPAEMQERPVKKAAIIQGKAKSALYKKFVSRGGGEGSIPDSKAVARQKSGKLQAWQVEQEYFAEMQNVYTTSRELIEAELAKPIHMKQARLLTDGKHTNGVTVYDYRDSLAQFDLGSAQRINRIDVHWGSGCPQKSVRMEVMTSNDPNAWHSITNDEPLWEGSVVRIGGTLHRKTLPGKNVTSLYLPERTVRYIRILFTSVTGEISEISIYGLHHNKQSGGEGR